jgi:uncharacterized protein YecT (DUF1311 family)
MRAVHLISGVVVALLLSGCGAQPVDCASESARNTIAGIVTDQLEKEAREAVTKSDGTLLASPSKIRATVAQIKVLFDDVRTTKKDPDSTKRFCEGTMRVVLPLGMLSDAEKAREVADMSSIKVLTEGAGFEQNANAFSHTVAFSVQPTDDKKKIFGEVEDFGSQFSTLGELIGAHLVLPTLQAQQQSAAATLQAEQTALAEQAALQSQADLEMAKGENSLATQRINEIWRAIPDYSRAEILDIQRAWIKKKTADCNIKAAETSTDPAAKEAARLRCDTEVTNSRSTELRAYLEQ